MAANTDKPYRRLPGTGYRRLVPGWAIVLLFFVIGIFALLLRGRRVQLWLGDTHLLLVEWDGYREYYKRFGFADIQSFSIRKTSDGRNGNIVLVCVLLLFVALGLSTDDTGLRIFLCCVAGFFGVCLLINTLLGPTCRCHARTAVQSEELPSLGRLRTAQKVLNQLRPLIQGAQGTMSAEELAARVQGQDAYASPPVMEEAVSPTPAA